VSWEKRGTKRKHIFIKIGGKVKERLSYLSMYLLYIVFVSFSQKVSRSLYARLIAFYPQLTSANMQRALPTPFIYIFIFSVIIPECQLAKFTENTHKIAHKMSKNCLRG